MRALVKTEREKEQNELKDGNGERSRLQANTPMFRPCKCIKNTQ